MLLSVSFLSVSNLSLLPEESCGLTRGLATPQCPNWTVVIMAMMMSEITENLLMPSLHASSLTFTASCK